MKREKALLVLLIGACSLMLSCSRGWQISINGTANGDDFATAVTIDGMGDVVAAGLTRNTGTGFGPTVVKFSGVNGTELWREVTGVVSQATAVRTDDAGDVVAAGFLANTGVVVKFGGVSGAELWRQVINGTANGADIASDVTVDSAGNIVAVGYTFNTLIYHDFTVIKFNGANGDKLWRQVISSAPNGASWANRVTVDGVGNVAVAGMTVNAGTGVDFTVIKFDGLSGAELWRQVINGSAYSVDWAVAVTADGAGDVVAAGYIDNIGTQDDFFVVKFDGATGAELWRQVINGTANGRDRAHSVAVDSKGDVVAAGFTVNTGTLDDFTVVKFDGVSGAELWRQVINGTANGNDFAYAAAVDSFGNVVAAGVTRNTGTDADFTVIKFDGVSGRELWRKVINGTANDVDAAYAVTVDAAGDVVAAGRTKNVGTGDDFTVVKLRGIDGSDF